MMVSIQVVKLTHFTVLWEYFTLCKERICWVSSVSDKVTDDSFCPQPAILPHYVNSDHCNIFCFFLIFRYESLGPTDRKRLEEDEDRLLSGKFQECKSYPAYP